jgi:hypothetical protein
MRQIGEFGSVHNLMKHSNSHPASRTAYPAWIDSQDYGVNPPSAVPRIRDSLILRLVAGRRQRARPQINAIGSP